jgi:uroporphyrinogen decarboxylase
LTPENSQHSAAIMNERERFAATMHYQQRDRSPICDFSFWEETLELWHEQGLPPSVNRFNSDDYFGMDGLMCYVLSKESSALIAPADPRRTVIDGVCVGLVPEFKPVVLEDRGDAEVIQQIDGVRVLKKKFMSSIPTHQSHLLVDRESWRKHYKPRLNPDDPRRYPDNWDECVSLWCDDRREFPIFLFGGSFYGWIRNWMGLEAVSLAVYDDPAWFEEMLATIADCVVGVLTRVLETGGRFEACSLWEDMCFNRGPLLSPEHFERFLVPHYRRLTDLLHRHGVDVVWVDCDGKIDQLVPLWLDAGVNCMFPIEVGTWGADAVEYRKEYGKDLLMIGGFDKRIFARGRTEIEAEVRRLAPLVEEGGFIGLCDHRVPPDVPLDNYMHYLKCVREVWGHNVNLKPLGGIM